MDEWLWVLVGFLVALFMDNLMGFLWAYWFGPERARKLIIEGLKDPQLGKDIRPIWGIPSVRHISKLERSLKAEVEKVKSGTELYVSEKDKDAIVRSVSASIRSRVSGHLDEWVKRIEDHIDKKVEDLAPDKTSAKDEEALLILSDPEVQDEFIEMAEEFGIRPRTAEALVTKGPEAIMKFGKKSGLWEKVLERI